MQMIFQDPYSSLNPAYVGQRDHIGSNTGMPTIHHKKDIEAKVLELMDTVGLAPRYVNAYRTSSTAAAASAWGLPAHLRLILSSSSATSPFPRWTFPSRPRSST
jgi:ABC-type antimicrobial peptide transport system ATPase subunit